MRGILGGEDRMKDLWIWNDDTGRSSSSSSDMRGERGSGTVDVSETKERLGACGTRPKRACRRWYTGDDSGRWKLFFHDWDAVVVVLTFIRLWLLVPG